LDIQSLGCIENNSETLKSDYHLNTTYLDRHADIIAACKLGDKQAQYRLYQLYSKAMYNICVRMLGERSLAEDALQEAFISAFNKLHTYEGRASFGAWLKRIVINKCLSHIKKQRIQFESLEDQTVEPIADTHQASSPPIDAQTIHEAIQSLPEGCRIVFTLYQLEGYDHKEISQIMKISVSTAKSQYHRAKKLLREKITSHSKNEP